MAFRSTLRRSMPAFSIIGAATPSGSRAASSWAIFAAVDRHTPSRPVNLA